MTIMQISWEVLLRFTKVAIWHRRCCVFQTLFFTGALRTQFSKMQYLWDEMLDLSRICITSNMIWSIRTCNA